MDSLKTDKLSKNLWMHGSQKAMENSSRDEVQTTLSVSWETYMQVKKQQQVTASKLGKEYYMGVACYHVYLTYMQSISCEMLSWMNHKLEPRFLGEIPTTPNMQMTPLLWR